MRLCRFPSNRTKSKKRHSQKSRRRRLLSETLEPRQLLAADPTFASFIGTIDSKDASESVEVQVSPEQVAASDGKIQLGFYLKSSDPDQFDPDPIGLTSLGDSSVRVRSTTDDLPDSLDSLLVAEVGSGTYQIDIDGQSRGRSGFELDVYLVGDASGDHAVSKVDVDQVQSAFGARIGEDRYRWELDGNLDGSIDTVDLTLAARNQYLSTDKTTTPVPAATQNPSPSAAAEPLATEPLTGGTLDKNSAVVPTAAYDPLAASQFFETTSGWTQPLASATASTGGVMTVPGTSNQQADITVDWLLPPSRLWQ